MYFFLSWKKNTLITIPFCNFLLFFISNNIDKKNCCSNEQHEWTKICIFISKAGKNKTLLEHFDGWTNHFREPIHFSFSFP